MEALAAGRATNLTENSGLDGRTVLAAAAPIPALGWTLIVEEPTEEAYGAARQLARQLFVAIGLAAIVTLTAGYYWALSLNGPIFALMRGTRALADGRLDERVDIRSGGDEWRLGAHSTACPTVSSSCRTMYASRNDRPCSAGSRPGSSTISRIPSRTSRTAASSS